LNPVNLNKLGLGRDEKWAVGHFNVHNLEFAKAVVKAAHENRSPAILAVGMLSIKYMGLTSLVNACRIIAGETDVPIALHLDHCKDLDMVRQALELGVNSVMFDGSALPYEENIAKTKEVVKMARDYGATTEGEVGIVPHGTDSVSQKDMTDPNMAVDFVERTAVDFVAVSLGSVHGMKAAGASLDQELLKTLREKVKAPLVLHGASGVLDDQIKDAVANGIRKINVNTGLQVVCKNVLSARFKTHPDSALLQDFECGIEAIAAAVSQKMELFNSMNKA